MKRLVIVVTLPSLLAGLVLLSSSDTGISVADASTPDCEVTSSTGDSSASATITITMYTVANK